MPRSDLLRRYGRIIEDHKQYDVVEISATSLAESAGEVTGLSSKDIEERIKLADSLDMWEDGFDIMRDNDNPTLLECLDVLTADKATFDGMRGLRNAIESGPKPAAAQTLRNCLMKRRRDYPTTIAQDVQKLREHLPRRLHMAVEIRMGEMQILAETIQYLGRFSFEKENTPRSRGPAAKRQKARS